MMVAVAVAIAIVNTAPLTVSPPVLPKIQEQVRKLDCEGKR